MQAHDFIDVNFGSKLGTGTVHIVFEVKQYPTTFQLYSLKNLILNHSHIRDLKYLLVILI